VDFYLCWANPLVVPYEIALIAWETAQASAGMDDPAYIQKFLHEEDGGGYLMGTRQGRDAYHRALDQLMNDLVSSSNGLVISDKIGRLYAEVDATNMLPARYQSVANGQIFPPGLAKLFHDNAGLHLMIDEATYKLYLELKELVTQQGLFGDPRSCERQKYRMQQYREIYRCFSACYGGELSQGRAPTLSSRTCFDKKNMMESGGIPGVVSGFLAVIALRCKCHLHGSVVGGKDSRGKRRGKRTATKLKTDENDDDDDDSDEDEEPANPEAEDYATVLSEISKDLPDGDRGVDIIGKLRLSDKPERDRIRKALDEIDAQ
jgi:hypothetical protein